MLPSAYAATTSYKLLYACVFLGFWIPLCMRLVFIRSINLIKCMRSRMPVCVRVFAPAAVFNHVMQICNCTATAPSKIKQQQQQPNQFHWLIIIISILSCNGLAHWVALSRLVAHSYYLYILSIFALKLIVVDKCRSSRWGEWDQKRDKKKKKLNSIAYFRFYRQKMYGLY